jgi:hypothetical protein
MSERNEGSDSSSSLGKDNQLFKNPESKLNQFVTSIDPENSKPGPYGDDEEGEFQEGSISKQEGGLDDKEEDSGEINEEEEDIPDDQEEQDNEENGAEENGEGDDNQEAEESEPDQESSSEKREQQPSASGQEQEEEEEDEEDEDLGIGNEPLNHFHLPG